MKNIFSHHVSLFFPHHPRARCWLHVILLWVDHQSDRKCLHLSFLAFSACWRCFRPRSAVQHQRFIRSHTIIRAIRALQCIPEGTSARLRILTHITPAHSSLSPSPLDICFFVTWFATSWQFPDIDFIITKGTERARKYGGFFVALMMITAQQWLSFDEELVPSPQVSLIISWSRNIYILIKH